MTSRYVLAFSTLVSVAAAITLGPMRTGVVAHGALASDSAVIPTCRLRLPPPRPDEPLFAVPAGGRATGRSLADRIVVCTLFRADGSRYARADIDRLRQVLDLRFFRESGRLLLAADAAYPAVAATQGAEVSCGSAAHETIGNRFWRQPLKWWVAKTPTKLPRGKTVRALRDAQSEWTNNINWCHHDDRADLFARYEGLTSAHFARDGISTVDWGSLRKTQNCNLALACAQTWYDHDGNPAESDVRFANAVDWSLQPGAGGYDLQSVAAHEFGHARQFGHVTSARRRQYTLIMWPYLSRGDTSGRKLGRGDSIANNTNY
jgi:Matrixin